MKASPPAGLDALIQSCASSGITRQALLLRTDRLPVALSRPHHLRLAEAALAPLLAISRAQMFHLPGPRYAVTWRGDADAVLMDVVDSLAHLLEDAPPNTPSLQELVFLFDLPQQGDLLQAAITEALATAAEPSLPPAPPLDPAELALLEASLAQADVARFARRRPVWRTGRGEPAVAWEKRTLSVGELAAGLMPRHDIQADPWLFRRLTRTFDRRMLSLLAHSGELAGAGPFSLDLNIASLLSPEFLRFDTALPGGLRNRVVIELMPADIMADAAAFVFARGFARVRGYRMLLRGVTPALAAVMALPALELDYLQCDWSSELAAGPLPSGCAAECTMLAGVGDPAAIAWGARNGISLFQGSAMDALALGERALGERVAAA